MLVDVHCHLDFREFDIDRYDIIDRAKAKGVTAIINNGLNPESNKKTLALCETIDILKPALGMHPMEVSKLEDSTIERELEFINGQRGIAAIGEVGLDFYKGMQPERQIAVFTDFIRLAEHKHLPIIVHTRKAEKECVELLESSSLKKVILHAFQGSKSLAKKAEDNGWFFSLPPSIVYTEQFQQMAKDIAVNQLLTETDSPFLGPVKEEKNEPANVSYVVEKIAELKGMDKEEVKNVIFMTFRRLFG
ncbi:MAG: TatD family hydrolase [Candidatus Woesearchaeota archaeon]